MAKNKTSKKKVVVSTTKKKVSPTTSSRQKASKAAAVKNVDLIFKKENYKWMAIGAVLIAIGLALMTGGGMPSPEVWDENIIYNWRITILSPIVILTGLGIEIYAIFKD